MKQLILLNFSLVLCSSAYAMRDNDIDEYKLQQTLDAYNNIQAQENTLSEIASLPVLPVIENRIAKIANRCANAIISDAWQIRNFLKKTKHIAQDHELKTLRHDAVLAYHAAASLIEYIKQYNQQNKETRTEQLQMRVRLLYRTLSILLTNKEDRTEIHLKLLPINGWPKSQ